MPLMKTEETDSLDTFIRHAVGKEPSFSFSRTTNTPFQWIQFLQTIDQQDLPGWPLLAPAKIQMQKCDKCAREFCSSINYRRHIRVHRRAMNSHKPQKYRDLLAAYWDKLSYNEAKEVMSFNNVNLEEVSGSCIVKTIEANLQKSNFLSFPQLYVKAGSALVDIIEARPSISSQELFSVLDDGSERTFLCGGTAESLHKYLFNGEAAKIGLEMRNVVACTCFLLEQKLVKAWLLDKDAEALRCTKLLVEEEEAAQRRQAELSERKKRRKIRQKEQRARKVDLNTDICESISSAENSSPQIFPEIDPTVDINHSDFPATEHHRMQGNGSHHVIARWQVPRKFQRSRGRNGQNGFYNNQNGNVIKWERVKSGSIWTKKVRPEEVVKSRVDNDAINQTTQSNNCQLMIGSISVTVRNSTGQHQVNGQLELQENSNTEIKMKTNGKFWRVQRGQMADRSNSHILEEDATSERGVDQNLSTESQQKSNYLNGIESEGTNGNHSNVQVEDDVKVERRPFSIDAAKAFLSQRWKDAITGEHVELVLPGPPGQLDEAQDHMLGRAKPTKPDKTNSLTSPL